MNHILVTVIYSYDNYDNMVANVATGNLGTNIIGILQTLSKVYL